MTRQAGTCVVFSLLFVAACGVGEDANTEERPPNPLGIECTDSFLVSGTFTASTARPVDVGGCWPAGTWTFSVSLDPTDDHILDITGDKLPDRCGKINGTSPAAFKSSYSFTVTRTDDGDGFVDAYAMNGGGFAADCSQSGDCVARLKVSSGGARECEAGLEIYSADRKQHWNLKPEQQTGETNLTGLGEYTQFINAQVP
jgi:hypothetical protein